MGSDDREDGHCEGDVGRGGNGPAAHQLRAGEQKGRADEGGDEDSTGRRSDRDDGGAEPAQVTAGEFRLEFDADEEEEDREQSVGGPLPDAQPQVPGFIAELSVSDREVSGRCRRVGPDQSGSSGAEEQCAADGVAAQRRKQAGTGRCGEGR